MIRDVEIPEVGSRWSRNSGATIVISDVNTMYVHGTQGDNRKHWHLSTWTRLVRSGTMVKEA